MALFLWSQIWGYGRRGYGPYRVSKILQGTPRDNPTISFSQTIGSCYETLLEDGPVEAYRLMANNYWIRGLGPAFLTKFLYFAGHGMSDRDHTPESLQPLILDAVVSRAIQEEYGIKFGSGWGTERYREYLEFMSTRARAEYGVEPDELEQALFTVGRL